MPGSLGATWYALATRALDEQERQVDSLRTRTGTIVAGAAVAATLLSGQVLVDTHPDGLGEWLATGVGVVGVAVVFAASINILRSHDLSFTVDVREAYSQAVEGAVDDAETVQRDLALVLSDVYAANDPTVFALRSWSRSPCWAWAPKSLASASARR